MALFTYVLLPEKDSEPAQLLQGSRSGGLEHDELQIYAKKHLSTEFDGHARMESVSEHLTKIGKDKSIVDEKYKNAIFAMGTTLDIVTLQLPNVKNGFVGVSIYCDANGIAKEYKPNTRATAIAQACGHSIVINGDAFISRMHDDESIPWERLDFGLEEISLSAPWIAACAQDNKGRDLRKYTSSGALSSAFNGVEQYVEPFRPETAPKVPDRDIIVSENVVWTQTSSDLEIRYQNIPANVTAKTIKVVIKPSRLHVSIPNYVPAHDTEVKLADSNGGELYGIVMASECTWSLDNAKNGTKTLVISLSKANSLNWLSILK